MNYFITAIIDGEKHYFTGGVSKKLPIFTTNTDNAYRYDSYEKAKKRSDGLKSITDSIVEPE